MKAGIRASLLRQGLTLVSFLQLTQLFVYVVILDVNDNPPVFPFTSKEYNVSEVSPVESQQVPSECGEGRGTEGCLGDAIREIDIYKSHSMARSTSSLSAGYQSGYNCHPWDRTGGQRC